MTWWVGYLSFQMWRLSHTHLMYTGSIGQRLHFEWKRMCHVQQEISISPVHLWPRLWLCGVNKLTARNCLKFSWEWSFLGSPWLGRFDTRVGMCNHHGHIVHSCSDGDMDITCPLLHIPKPSSAAGTPVRTEGNNEPHPPLNHLLIPGNLLNHCPPNTTVSVESVVWRVIVVYSPSQQRNRTYKTLYHIFTNLLPVVTLYMLTRFTFLCNIVQAILNRTISSLFFTTQLASYCSSHS